MELASRWVAARISRRSFLERLGVVAMVVMGGSALSTLFAKRAGARQCGQEGYAPSCDTFDCVGPGMGWGWCWYATPGACCTDGGLKKICDCCLVDYPYYQGYCPDGMAVYCMVESCLADPRLSTVPIDRSRPASTADAALDRARRWADRSAPTVVLADGRDRAALLVAAPVAAALDGPLLVLENGQLSAAVTETIARLGTRRFKIVGPALDPAIDRQLGGRPRVERLHQSAEMVGASEEVAKWLRATTKHRRRLVCVTPAALSSPEVTAAAGAFAATNRAPIVLSADAAQRITHVAHDATTVHVVGPDPGAALAVLPTALVTQGSTPHRVALELAGWTLSKGSKAVLTIVPEGSLGLALGAIPSDGPLVSHPDGVLDVGLRDWIIGHQESVRAAHCLETVGALDLEHVYALQSALNRFDVHRLIGGAGDGFPVYAQLSEEEGIGAARETGPVDPDTRIPYYDDDGNYFGPPLP
jgi:hypothetical protein